MKITRTVLGYVPKKETMAMTVQRGLERHGGISLCPGESLSQEVAEVISGCMDTTRPGDGLVKRRVRITIEVENE